MPDDVPRNAAARKPHALARKPHALAALRPPALDGVVLDFAWSTRRLHALDLPAAELPVADLRWHLDLPFWAHGGRFFAVTPRQVAADPLTYREQYARTMAADLRYPIHVLDGGGGRRRRTILDGVHRLLKAHLAGAPTITAALLAPADLDLIAEH